VLLLLAMAKDVAWRRAGSPVYVRAAVVEGCWWVLRLNDFPEHPLYTLFIDGDVIGDVDDLPGRWEFAVEQAGLSRDERDEVLGLMRGLARYGAEAGQPCDGDWCTCSILTDDYAALDGAP
jgi:hypothetical protein